MPTSYPDTYFPVLVQIAIAVLVSTALVALSYLIGKKVKDRVKDSPYECGIVPTGSARERFSVKFYLVAIVFILFDVEAIFLYPWAYIYKQLRWFGFVEMILYIGILLVGYFYLLKKGALDWNRPAERRDRAS